MPSWRYEFYDWLGVINVFGLALIVCASVLASDADKQAEGMKAKKNDNRAIERISAC